MRILRRTARVVLVDGDDLVLIRRTRPGFDVYWVTPGGGVEAEDADVEAAMRRELHEELGATARAATVPVYVLTDVSDRGVKIHHFFVAELASMDLAERHGPEFQDPTRGAYDVERVPFTDKGIRSVDLRPPELADYLAANAVGLLALLRDLS